MIDARRAAVRWGGGNKGRKAMNDLDNNAIDRLLAEKVMGWTLVPDMWVSGNGSAVAWAFGDKRFKPSFDRNDLADVLAKLTPEQWDELKDNLEDEWFELGQPAGTLIRWSHTCDPAIIARAVAEVVR